MVQLIHQTVREFLLDRRHLARPYDLDEVSGDREIALTCCFYILVVFKAALPQMEADECFSQVHLLTTYLSENDLLRYSLLYITKHLDHLGNNGEDIRQIFSSFVRDLISKPSTYASLLLSKWIRSMWSPLVPWAGPSQVDATGCLQAAFIHAAGSGEDQAVEILLGLRADVDSCDSSGRNAIGEAAKQGRSLTINLLLSIGVVVPTWTLEVEYTAVPLKPPHPKGT